MKSQRASNVPVLGTGASSADHAHVKKGTPLDLKRREFEETKKFRTNLNAGLDTARQSATRKARQHGKVRPLGGS
jgi:hypothetical protein